MERALSLYRTTVGKKAVMGASGVVLFGFIIVHLVGNLKLYAGPDVIYHYAGWLRSLPFFGLWVARVLLAAAVVAHISSAYQLWRTNREARPVRYHVQRDLVTNYAAKTMYLSGPILLCYIVFHVAHLTLGSVRVHPFDHYNVYNNVVYGFRVWWVSAFYIAGNLALGLHLYHGAWSLFQSLGINHPRHNLLRRRFATALAVAITVGNVSFPIAVMLGFIQPTDQIFSPW